MAHDDSRDDEPRIHSVPCDLHELDDNAATDALREIYRSHGALRALAGLACGARLGNDLDNVEREDLSSLLLVLGDHLRANSQVLDRFVADFGISRYHATHPQPERQQRAH